METLALIFYKSLHAQRQVAKHHFQRENEIIFPSN